MKRYLFFAAVIPFFFQLQVAAQYSTQRKPFNKDWKFFLGAVNEEVTRLNFDDSKWRSLQLPHDWSIGLPFDSTSPTGNGGGALRGGLGWYRKTFTIPVTEKNKRCFIDFDGIYMNSEVFMNGHSLGVRPNGYISFRYDLTPYLRYGAEKNILVVKVDNSVQPNSRWYSGSGIYRNVWISFLNPVHVAHWGTYITTPSISGEKASVRLETKISNESGADTKYVLQTIIIDPSGKKLLIKDQQSIAKKEEESNIITELAIAGPSLWSVEKPVLYQAVMNVLVNGKIVDTYQTPFGIRYFRFDADKGFFLNDQHLKIRGVCMHHDLGCLGTAINKRALQRQLEILKGMGVNAIRTSHNPPSPELLELSDEMGFLIMDEAFDMWARPKTKYDYHLYWNDWHKKDLEDQLLRDRNHPSVFMWSVGNEIPEQWAKDGDTSGKTILRELIGIVKSIDGTRPTVTANDQTGTGNQLLQAGLADVIGYNYHQKDWDSVFYRWGKKPFIVTESVSALQTRGHYDMPSDSIRRWPVRWDLPFTTGNDDLTCSAYDNCSAPWGSTHEETMSVFENNDHISGMFIWTGFDYIGEPTPYPWPARSSYFGIVDLAGFPKDVYYMYKSMWTDKPVLHIFPHWNWKKGDTVDVWGYYNNADEVELFLNGKSLGVRKKTADDFHVMWRVIYEPGVLKAVSKKEGKIVLTKEIKTAGKPAKILLKADRARIKADGNDLSFVTVTIVDKDGNKVPDAGNLVQFTVTGEGTIAGVDNGSETSMESFKADHRKAFNGLCLAVLKTNGKKGTITLKASSANLQGASLAIVSE